MRSTHPPLLSPGRVAIAYFAVGSLTLVFSDVILAGWVDDPGRLRSLQTVTGATEVVLTATLIYGLLAVYRRSLDRQREETERARDRFASLNSLLRHHVLNRMNVIQGYVRELQRTGGVEADRLETIQGQSAAVVDLIENVRALSRRPGEGDERHRLDLSAMLAEAVETAREEYPDAEIGATIPPAIHVEADESLSLVFENLLQNAVEHNDSHVPRVTVDVDPGPGRATVGVADNGPGLPQDALGTDVEATARGDEGLGLFLARTLVARHDGDLRVDDEVEEGARVLVELPRASAE